MIDIITKLKYICTGHKIYLYGAGKYGRTLYAYMQEQNLGHIEKFIVSEQDAQCVVLGKEVITLEDYGARRMSGDGAAEEDLIIIAVSEKYDTEIIGKLESRKIYHYVTLTQEEWNIIDRATLFKCIIPYKNIAILMYHRIIDSDYNFWKLNVTPATFEKHIKYISENYRVLRLEEDWGNIVEAGQKYVVITFDDGYVDNYQFALPVLEKYYVPATIFVSTDLIDTDEMYWWDELEKMFIIDKYFGKFMFDGTSYTVTDSDSRKDVCVTIRNHIKNMNPIKRKESMDELRAVLGLEQPETSELRCVRTSELTRMAGSPCITIGGHTKSHLSMGNIHPEELLRSEIEKSLSILTEKTGKKPDVFAYPFGGAEDRCNAADRIISECGIRKSVLVKNGNVNVNDKMYNLPRHMVFEGEDMKKKLNKIWGIYG